MLISFEREITEKHPELFNIIQNKYYVNSLVAYMINSKYKKSVILREWLNNQIQNPTTKLKEFCDTITNSDDYDKQAILILRKVQSKLKYVGDTKTWDMNEYWQTADETINRMTGDCEDGAILMYVLCRLKGIPANRLLIMAGSVNGGGHCWLGYKPICYPLNFVFLDWCYWYNSNNVDLRNKFYINDNKIYEYDVNGLDYISNYYNVWFVFNEEVSNNKYKFEVKNLLR